MSIKDYTEALSVDPQHAHATEVLSLAVIRQGGRFGSGDHAGPQAPVTTTLDTDYCLPPPPSPPPPAKSKPLVPTQQPRIVTQLPPPPRKKPRSN